MNIKELNREIEALNCLYGDKTYIAIDDVFKLVEQLDEPQKPVVKQFVADWYEKNKDSFDYNLWAYLTDWEEQESSDFKN